MKFKAKILFKQNMEFEGKEYSNGSVHEFDMEKYRFDRLTRRGCIYAPDSAELSKVEVKVAEPVKVDEPKELVEDIKETKPKKELNNVDSKKNSRKAKIQAESIDQE